MRATDRVTTDQYGVSSERLMTRAGEAVAGFVLRQFPEAQSVVAICGKGNNGGDGIMAAAALARTGRTVHVLLLGRKDELGGDPAQMLRKSQPQVPVVE